MRFRREFGLIFACLCFSGCATMFGDSKDLINVRSNDPEAALFFNGNPLGNGSAQYSLSRGTTGTFTARKPGCLERSVPVERRLVGATFLNLLFWPGFIIDAASGSMQKADPTDYVVEPDCSRQWEKPGGTS